jgi:dihydroorotase-like cyclic amidohydrolase
VGVMRGIINCVGPILLIVVRLKVDLVVKNGRLVSPKGIVEGGVAIEDGVIVAVAKEPYLPDADRVIDARGLVVLPGVLDGHVHAVLPPEDSSSGTKAAAKGGITTVLEIPGSQMGGFNPGQFGARARGSRLGGCPSTRW